MLASSTCNIFTVLNSGVDFAMLSLWQLHLLYFTLTLYYFPLAHYLEVFCFLFHSFPLLSLHLLLGLSLLEDDIEKVEPLK